MFVVTFYSYKGGVGRTMALANTAIGLARAGSRVLVVDFDLEAPGLPSYSAFKSAPCGAGIVDYVNAYRTTGIAPIAADYIYPCDIEKTRMWIMPAGRHTQPGYNEALNSIDWQDIYDHQQGYLMVEDLRQQWAEFEGKGFDYVLIDSRTGHTDVGGICTRQLPDAVAILFVPNEQNIAGLVPIVNGIRAEKHRRRPIALEFYPSNVPDLDDEKEILGKRIAEAESKLGYKDEPARHLHHYASLDVLAQQIFVLSRPNSKLAREYETLRQSIIALNFDDPEGAVVALDRMPADYERARVQSRAKIRDELRARAVDIRARHPHDGEIAYRASRVFAEIGDLGEEIEALSSAIRLNYEANRARLTRAYSYAAIGRNEEALADFRAVVESPSASFFELAPALQYLQEADRDWVDALSQAYSRPDSETPTLFSLAWFALMHREALPPTADRMEQLSHSSALTPEQRADARNRAALAMVGSGQFSRAKAYFGNIKVPFTDPSDHADLFNFMIADWGERGVVASELLAHVREGFARAGPLDHVNSNQCAALVHALAGDEASARQALASASACLQAGDYQFSCWRYLYVDADAMSSDLDAMRASLDTGRPLLPAFFGEVGAGVLS